MTEDLTPMEAAEQIALAAQNFGQVMEDTRRQVEKERVETDEAISNLENEIDSLRKEVQAFTGSRV